MNETQTFTGELYNIVAEFIREKGGTTDRFLVDHHVNMAKGKEPNIQRFFLNEYFRMRFGRLAMRNINTAVERSFLVEDGEIGQWAMYIRDNVIPTLVQHNEL